MEPLTGPGRYSGNHANQLCVTNRVLGAIMIHAAKETKMDGSIYRQTDTHCHTHIHTHACMYTLMHARMHAHSHTCIIVCLAH